MRGGNVQIFDGAPNFLLTWGMVVVVKWKILWGHVNHGWNTKTRRQSLSYLFGGMPFISPAISNLPPTFLFHDFLLVSWYMSRLYYYETFGGPGTSRHYLSRRRTIMFLGWPLGQSFVWFTRAREKDIFQIIYFTRNKYTVNMRFRVCCCYQETAIS